MTEDAVPGPGTPPTPEQLCEIEAIRSLKHAYLRCLDQKLWDAIGDLFTEDATAAYSGGAYTAEGRDGIVDFLRRNMGSETFHSSHRVTQPEIVVSGDTATGTWALDDTVVDLATGYVLFGGAFYEDRYVRHDGRWWISHTGYRRSFEVLVPAGDLPGMALTASWWGTGGRSSLPVT